ncbi:hypothetical protein RDI58_013588 [Solanum bulbocastanum]|uniref:Uncharacterized protein n=1 Tax=Solanum bulbocastanum TaxID=147425 RepID=A0AAN8TS16_SOLBU
MQLEQLDNSNIEQSKQKKIPLDEAPLTLAFALCLGVLEFVRGAMVLGVGLDALALDLASFLGVLEVVGGAVVLGATLDALALALALAFAHALAMHLKDLSQLLVSITSILIIFK